jgi:soluble lytic murein transglycosylase-like protein
MFNSQDKQIKLLYVATALNIVVTAGLVSRTIMLTRDDKSQQKQINSMSQPFDLLKAMIQVESSGNPKAYNKYSGAVGLLQLTEIVYKNICGLTKQQAFNPEKNVACGALYFQYLLNKFGGNTEKALVFYNSGNSMSNSKYAKKVLNKQTEVK